MAKIPLPDHATLLKLLRYEPETGRLFWRRRPPELFCGHDRDAAWRKWNTRYADKEAFTASRNGYRCGGIFTVIYPAHRVIWAMLCGVIDDREIDHIDGDRGNNRPANLRLVSAQGNARNASISSANTSGVLGVDFNKKARKWRATIKVNYRKLFVGEFRLFDDAVAARKAAERKYGFHPNHGRVRSC